MSTRSTSVLIPSYRRPQTLLSCLRGLARQDLPPGEVLVVWQDDDSPTRDAAESIREGFPHPLRILHSPTAGVVPAENTALRAATGEILLLIDDDAIAPPDWIARHLAHYDDPSVGAVGGPAVNHRPDGSPFPTRDAEPIGKLTWFGRPIGNMFDHIPEWRGRPPRDVDHLVGYNLSLRRSAIGHFEEGLRRYWQMFEMDACLQVKAGGLRVVFDFANVVEHHPTNTAYVGNRGGDLETKIFHAAYNHAFVLAKHSPPLLRPFRLLYLLGVGSVGQPGILALPIGLKRFGNPGRELGILKETLRHHLAGWRAGAAARKAMAEPRTESLPGVECSA